MTCLSKYVTYSLNDFSRGILLLRTSRVRRTPSAGQAIGIAAAELLEKSNRGSSLGRCHAANRRTNGSFCYFMQQR
jgi:hypothetical protein